MSMVSKDTKSTQTGATSSSTADWDTATTPGTWRNLEMWLATVVARPLLWWHPHATTRRSFRENKTTFIGEKGALVPPLPVSQSP